MTPSYASDNLFSRWCVSWGSHLYLVDSSNLRGVSDRPHVALTYSHTL